MTRTLAVTSAIFLASVLLYMQVAGVVRLPLTLDPQPAPATATMTADPAASAVTSTALEDLAAWPAAAGR